MAKFVDRYQWRAVVTAAAAELIAEEGLGGMTFRHLAARLGCSTTVISHYFANRTELLQSVYRATNAEAARVRTVALGDSGRTPIESLEDLLPIAPDRQRIWRIWLSFWNSAMFDAELREMHARGIAGTRGSVFKQLVACGMSPSEAEAGAEDVQQAIFGIAMQAMFDQGYWNPDRQLAAFRRAVARITGSARPAAVIEADAA